MQTRPINRHHFPFDPTIAEATFFLLSLINIFWINEKNKQTGNDNAIRAAQLLHTLIVPRRVDLLLIGLEKFGINELDCQLAIDGKGGMFQCFWVELKINKFRKKSYP